MFHMSVSSAYTMSHFSAGSIHLFYIRETSLHISVCCNDFEYLTNYMTFVSQTSVSM